MTTAEPTAPKLPRRFLWHHPLVFLALWLGGVAHFAFGALVTLAYPFAYVPAAHPLAAAIVGLVGGLASVATDAWRVRKQFDAEVRAMAFGEGIWPLALTTLLPYLVIAAVTFAVPVAVLQLPGVPSVLLTLGCFVLPCPLFYHVYRPVCERAAALLIAASAAEADAFPEWLGSRRVAVTLSVLVVLSAVGTLGVAAWLQSL